MPCLKQPRSDPGTTALHLECGHYDRETVPIRTVTIIAVNESAGASWLLARRLLGHGGFSLKRSAYLRL
ncbi:hypothetical protein BBBOND_0300130 [Babesia bigemina]|uniref:Uncharacterized protein n=1 Tax=Babesia bigemina TaxID=5866 RepID=A0A061D6C6_BABBI|nr:hypothetical protein BBBOND_0300130 [Babesia bigemina]CDR96108.1 hypothetical protein BBBOND_0300130 [Babesia bigemina]|eukprot:XP_012768294.1 hypothetical protein BBBOND_0300130 [Babesia bigemina]